MAQSRITVEEIDRLIENLDRAIEGPIYDSERPSDGTGMKGASVIRLEVPAELWQKFVEHCAQNQLDPAEQLRDAVTGYYKDLLKTLRIRTRLGDAAESKLV